MSLRHARGLQGDRMVERVDQVVLQLHGQGRGECCRCRVSGLWPPERTYINLAGLKLLTGFDGRAPCATAMTA